MFMKVSKVLLVSLGVLWASACSEAPMPTNDGQVGAEQTPECPPAADVGVPQLTDEEIAQVVITLNRGEIEQSQLALQQNLSPDVRTFAERMVQEHTAVEQQLQAALLALGLTPRESPVSRQLQAGANQVLEILRASGTDQDFERAYMDAQVALHANVLFLLDAAIQRQIERREVRDFATQARATVQGHLNAAVPLQQAIPPRP